MSAKRRRRAAAKQKSPPLVQDENESGDPNERPTRDRHPNVKEIFIFCWLLIFHKPILNFHN